MKARTVLILMFMYCTLFGQNQKVQYILAEADQFLNKGQVTQANSLFQSIYPTIEEQTALDKNKMLALQAKIWKKQNQLEKADELYEELILSFENLGEDIHLASCLKEQAIILCDYGDYDTSKSNLARAKSLLEGKGENEEMAKVNIAISVVYQELEDDENQEKVLLEALELLENSDNDYLKGIVHFNLANFYYFFAQKEQLKENLEKARFHFRKDKNAYLLVKVEQLKIAVSSEDGEEDDIIRNHYETLIEEVKGYQDSFLLAEVHYNYAVFESNLLIDENNQFLTIAEDNKDILSRSTQLAEQAYNYLPKQNRISSLSAEAMFLIADLKYLSQEYQESFDYLTAAQAIQEKLGENEEINRSSFQSQLEIDRAEAFIAEQNKNLTLLRSVGGLLGGVVILLISLLFYSRRVNFVQQKSLRLKLFGDFLQTLDKEKEQFQKKERKRISKNLHDKVSSQLAAIKWLFESKVDDLEQNKLASGDLDSIMKMIEDAYAETRILSREIETEGPTTRLLALRNRLAAIEHNDRLKVEFSIEGFAGKPILYTIEDHISSIVMEMMANTFKYANATSLKIHIKRTEKEINLHVSDDGIGFDMNKHRNGHGVRNIYERVSDMNGEVEYNAQLGKGVQLDILIPLERA